MRGDVQKVFITTPRVKQVMMFSATMPDEIRPICRKFMTDVRVLSLLYSMSSCHSPLVPPLHVFNSRSRWR